MRWRDSLGESSLLDAEVALAGTPYLIASEEAALRRLAKAEAKARETRDRAVSANERIRKEAEAALAPYIRATRMDVVAESNIIEGYNWTQQSVREAIATHAELLDGSLRTLVQSVRQDPRVYEVLGLFQAHPSPRSGLTVIAYRGPTRFGNCTG